MSSLERVVVPVDGSEGAAKAARFAGGLARDTGARLVLLHVYDSTVISVMGLNALSGKEIDDAIARVSRGYFESAQRALPDGVTADTKVRIGNPSSEIVAYAETEEPDLIVMGSRGQSNFRRLFVGSVSQQVMQHAPCPVTVVR